MQAVRTSFRGPPDFAIPAAPLPLLGTYVDSVKLYYGFACSAKPIWLAFAIVLRKDQNEFFCMQENNQFYVFLPKIADMDVKKNPAGR